jgi:6-pyruvoyltetrahydropterin/6-carboxytetrahydropterin synthase
MHSIKKKFSFCYGHRVWTQKLAEGYAIDPACKCKHLHGHEGEVTIELTADKLTNSMVTDFKNLGWFKKWLDDSLDHKLIIDLQDPLFEVLLFSYNRAQISNPEYFFNTGWFWKVASLEGLPQHVHDLVEGIVITNFVPTSENLAEWLFKIVEGKMKPLGVTVKSVKLQETPSSCATYTK